MDTSYIMDFGNLGTNVATGSVRILTYVATISCWGLGAAARTKDRWGMVEISQTIWALPNAFPSNLDTFRGALQ